MRTEEERKAYARKYYQDNKEKMKEYERQYYKQYYEKNKDKFHGYYEKCKTRYQEYYQKKKDTISRNHRFLDYEKKLELQEYNRLYYRNRNKCKTKIYPKIQLESVPISEIAVTKGKFIIEF